MRKFIIAILFFISFSNICFANENPLTSDTTIPEEIKEEELLNRAIIEKDTANAEKYLEQLRKEDGDNDNLLEKEAEILILEKKYNEAIKCLNKLNINDNILDEFLFCYKNLKDYKNIIKIADIALQQNIDKEKWLKIKADTYYKQNNFEQAINIYQELFEQYNKAEYGLNVINCLIKDGKYKEAEELAKKVYYSPNKNKDVAAKYLETLHLNGKLKEAYIIAEENNLLETPEGIIIQADLGVGFKDSTIARSGYDNVLVRSAYDKFSQMGLSHSYISIASNLKSLKELRNLEETEETQFLKAKAYYNIEMFKESMDILKTLKQTDRVLEQENKIKRSQAYSNSECYDLYLQKLSEEFKLDAQKMGFSNWVYKDNTQIFFDYIMNMYSSGRYKAHPSPYINFANELRLGAQGRISEHWAARGDIGVKIFQVYGAKIITDSWIKYFPNDKINFKFGFQRNNLEQTYLSAVGVMRDGKFTGQISDNNWYVDTTVKLPKNGYLFTRGGIGYLYGYNVSGNIYWEGMLGIGKVLRYDLSKPYLQKITVDFATYNSGYQHNMINMYDTLGFLYGGYYSPQWYSDNTINLNFSGRIKETGISYGYGGFGGWQYAYNPCESIFVWGVSFNLSYKVNDHINLGTQYRFYNYANVQRNQWSINLSIKLYRKNKKK